MGAVRSKILSSSAKMANPEIQQFVKEAVAKDKVVIFSKTYCPYCTMAKKVFTAINHPVTVIELDERNDGSEVQDVLSQITGFRTVPQVFINGNCVGGGSDVKALHEKGQLESMLIG